LRYAIVTTPLPTDAVYVLPDAMPPSTVHVVSDDVLGPTLSVADRVPEDQPEPVMTTVVAPTTIAVDAVAVTEGPTSVMNEIDVTED